MAMEVLPAQYPVHTPQTVPITRASRQSRAPLPANVNHQQQHSAPASQDSILSDESNYPYTLQKSSSNVSQITNMTDLSDVAVTAAARDEPPLASPMSIASPSMVNGTKRTASGHVKNAQSISTCMQSTTISPRRARAESTSSTGSRVGELAASLKTRLGYAMTKVHHGWEYKNLGELEHMTAKPVPSRYSMSHIESARPQTGYDTRHENDNPMSPPSKRRSGLYGVSRAIPQLQPSVDFHKHQRGRSVDMKGLSIDAIAMSPPQTPVSHAPTRPATIRTNTQTAEAERDALQALTQLGSPHNSQYSRHHNVSQNTSSQASPLRGDFVPVRRVSFARGSSDSSASASG